MKKYLYSMLAASMLFACSEEELVDITKGEGQQVTFKVAIPAVQSRTVNGIELGAGTQANNLICAMYENGAEGAAPLIKKLVKDSDDGADDGTFTVTVPMAKDIKYDLLFLAYNEANCAFVIDATTPENTNLKELEFDANQKANIDAYDAFVGALEAQGVNDPNTVTLKRPFAQINAATTKADLDNAEILKLNVTQSNLVIKNVPKYYNVLEGTASSTTIDVTYSSSAIMECDIEAEGDYKNEKIIVENKDYYYLTLAYVLAGEVTTTSTHEATFQFLRADDTPVSTLNIINLPIQRNYRTNIIGDLLTKNEEYTISIDAEFGGAHNYPVQEITATYEAVFEILNNNIQNTEALTYNVEASTAQNEVTITIPDETSAASLTFNLNNLTDNASITITNDDNDNTSYNKTVVIEVPENVNQANLTINLPSAHVIIKQGQFEKVTGSTSNTTLEIPNGVIIKDLEIKAGNAVIYYGAVTGTITKNGNEITWLVDTKEQLENIAAAVNDGKKFEGEIIKLSADIDLNNEQWTSIGTSKEKTFEGTFDGGNYTIKNLEIIETEAKEDKAYIGFFGYAKNATIKNVTFENVKLNIACLDIDHSQGHIGAVAGSLEGTSTIENVTVKGDIKVEATFEANGASRVAVVAGGNESGNVTMKNVHVIANEGSYLKANNNVGALAGQLQVKNVFENCSSNIDVTAKKFFAGGLIGLAAGNSTFINCHTTGDVTVTAGREGRANDHYRVGGIAGGWADNTTNPCTLTDCSYTGKVSGANADGSVAEPLDYAGFVGRGYTLTNRAGSKVIIDGVEYVQASNSAFGNYYVNGVCEISNAAGMKWFADEVNVNRNTFAGKTVKLVADIDLNNIDWNPIGQTGVATFNGVFDGQNHTIFNLSVDSQDETGANYSSGLFGWVESHTEGNGHIKNVKISGATIVGNHNCGALVGYITQQTALVENCHVTGATITCHYANSDADGDKAGALIGNATVATPVKNCTAANSTVTAGRDAGQVIGAGKEANVTGCSATDVTVSHTDEEGTTGANIRNEVIGRLL